MRFPQDIDFGELLDKIKIRLKVVDSPIELRWEDKVTRQMKLIRGNPDLDEAIEKVGPQQLRVQASYPAG